MAGDPDGAAREDEGDSPDASEDFIPPDAMREDRSADEPERGDSGTESSGTDHSGGNADGGGDGNEDRTAVTSESENADANGEEKEDAEGAEDAPDSKSKTGDESASPENDEESNDDTPGDGEAGEVPSERAPPDSDAESTPGDEGEDATSERETAAVDGEEEGEGEDEVAEDDGEVSDGGDEAAGEETESDNGGVSDGGDEAAGEETEDDDEEIAENEEEAADIEDEEADDADESADDEEPDEDEADSSGVETVDMHDDATPLERKTGPQSDQEQPLAVHIEEMVKRLGIVVVVAGLVSLAAFPLGEDFITFLWYSMLPAEMSQPHVYHPLELVMTQLKAASLLGLVIALPVFVYETYAFMRPGLYPNERRYYLAAVPTSLILAFVGLLFGYFLVLPLVMNYFLYYSRDVVDIAFALGQTFGLMLILLGYLALVFQIPLFVMLAIMMGLTTRTWLEDRRLIFWGVFLGVSFLFSPDPTGMAPLVVAATMIGLFEGTLLLLRWTNRGNG